MSFSSLPRLVKIFLLLLALVVVNGWILFIPPEHNPLIAQRKSFTYEQKDVEVYFKGGIKKVFKADVADTDEKQNQGLSFREKLESDRAMIFPMDPAEKDIAFYMRDMNFPLDIYYIDKEGRVVQAMRALQPCAPTPIVCPTHENTSGKEIANVLEVVPQEKEIEKVIVR